MQYSEEVIAKLQEHIYELEYCIAYTKGLIDEIRNHARQSVSCDLNSGNLVISVTCLKTDD